MATRLGNNRPPRPNSRNDFHIAIFCALTLEADAVDAVFDFHWDDDGLSFDKTPGDPNAYSTGVIGRHNVVLAHMPGMGVASAASVASACKTSFPNISLGLVVGVCGVVPGSDDNERVLGDVIISEGVVQYDFGRQMDGHFERKSTLLDSLGRPPADIRALLAKVRGLRGREQLEKRTASHLSVLQQRPKLCAAHPGKARDRLFEPDHKHQDDGKTCDELGCDGQLVTRQRLLPHLADPSPAVHFGLIASGSSVMKSGRDRDRVAKKEDVIAFEMEGAGAWDSFPCVVLKGACDYADSHKNKAWQRYAAAAAAACMKGFLQEWMPAAVAMQTVLVPYPKDESFVQRVSHLEALTSQLLESSKADIQQDLRSWLRSVPDEGYKDSLQRRLDGTCCWVHDKSAFLEWASSKFSSGVKMLWIHGPAGFGKTILCASIVEHIATTLPTPIAHFFFSSDLDSRDDTTVALRSFLWQIATQHDAALQYMLQQKKADIDPIATSSTIEHLFKNVVRLVTGSTFVVDGLDECTRVEGSKSISKFIESLTSATAGTDTRILVVSRSLLAIQHALRSHTFSTISEIRIQPEDLRPDIVACSRRIVDRQLSKKDDEFRLSLSEALVRRCEGQFLWLELQGKWLRPTMSKRKIQEGIEDAPAELDRVYDHSWKKITQLREADRHRAFAILRWTAFALRPLTTSEITEAVIVKDAKGLPSENLPDELDEDYVDGEIHNLCSPLLEIRGGPSTPIGQRPVHLTHFTVREYLLHKLPAPEHLRSDTTILNQVQHTLLAKVCLRYIRYEDVWQINPLECCVPLGASFRSYAATFWHRHINFGQHKNSNTNRLAVEFLTDSGPANVAWRSLVELDDRKNYRWSSETRSFGPLHLSAKFQLKEVAMALIEAQNCGVNETSNLGTTALSIACSNGFVEVAAMLLEKGASPSLADKDGLLPIHWAAQNGHVEVIRLLLKDHIDTRKLAKTKQTKQEMDANVLDIYFKTPLHHSVLHDQPECVEVLLEHGADLTGDIDNMTPLHYAVSVTSEDITQCFLAAGVPIDSRVKRSTWRQEYHKDKPRYTRSNDGVHDPEPKNSSQGLTALHYAALIGCRRMTKFLLERGADSNAVSDYGETALHLALKRDIYGPEWPDFIDRWSDPAHRIEDALSIIGYGPGDLDEYTEMQALVEADRSDVVGLLLDHGSTNVILKDMYGASALHNVLYERTTAPKIINRLIEKGADVMERNHHGQTPLHLACSKGNEMSVETILHHGADITACDSEGLNALHYAAQSGDMETIQHLFTCTSVFCAGDFAASRDRHGRNALHHLLCNPGVVNYEVVAYLINRGTRVNDLDDTSMSPLALYLEDDFVLLHDAPPVVRLILQSGSDPSFRTLNGGLGLAHLHAKSCRVNVELLMVLADGGVDLQAEDDTGRTVLHWCAIAGSLTTEAFHFLCIESGLSKESLDAHGKTPQEHSTEMKKKECHPETFDRDRWSRTEDILNGSN